jgi:hypothetical protein
MAQEVTTKQTTVQSSDSGSSLTSVRSSNSSRVRPSFSGSRTNAS